MCNNLQVLPMPTRTLENTQALLAFGQHVARLRKEADISQEELSARCDLDRTYISGIERGKRNLSLTNILKIAKALNLPPKSLLDY